MSRLFTTSVAMFEMHDITAFTNAQPIADPWTVEGWEMMGPRPCARTIHQMKNPIPAMGATMDWEWSRAWMPLEKCVATVGQLLVEVTHLDSEKVSDLVDTVTGVERSEEVLSIRVHVPHLK
jgi:hypothetical protein